MLSDSPHVAVRSALASAEELLSKEEPTTPVTELSSRLLHCGFEKGWGCDAATILASMRLLQDLIQVSVLLLLRNSARHRLGVGLKDCRLNPSYNRS